MKLMDWSYVLKSEYSTAKSNFLMSFNTLEGLFTLGPNSYKVTMW